MKLADRISLELQKFLCEGSSDIVIPNYYVGFYEMDVFRLLSSGMLWEYEIKISRADFKNDFKKGSKHALMANKKGYCNRFYFVTPSGLLHVNEIPTYAGLIEFEIYKDGDIGRMSITKTAPIIHKTKVDMQFYKTIAYKLSFRERSSRAVLRRIALKNDKEARDKKQQPSGGVNNL